MGPISIENHMGLSIDTAPEVAGAKTEWIDLHRITLDDMMQPRIVTSEDTIRRYKDALRHNQNSLPPILVADFNDGEPLVVIDGWHRFKAHEELGLGSIRVRVIQCSRRRAEWLAALANTTHGLPLKRGDHRRTFRRYVRARANRNPDGTAKSYREMVEDLNGMRVASTIHKWTGEDFPKLAAELAGRDPDLEEQPEPGEQKTSHAARLVKNYTLGIVRVARLAVKEDREDLREDLLWSSLCVTENLGHILGISPETMLEVAREAEWRSRNEDCEIS